MLLKLCFGYKTLFTRCIFLALLFTAPMSLMAEGLRCHTSYSLKDLNTLPSFEYSSNSFGRGYGDSLKKVKIDNRLKSRWSSPDGEVKSVTIVVHGMNFKSNYMNNVIEILNNSGSKVLNVSLPGYREKLDSKTGKLLSQKVAYYDGHSVKVIDKLSGHPERNTDLEMIHEHLMKAYCIAKREADNLGVNVNYSGFSLGSLGIESLLNNPKVREHIDLEKMILFAPVITSKLKTALYDLLVSLFPFYKKGGFDEDYHYLEEYGLKYFKPMVEANELLLEYGHRQANINTLVVADIDDAAVDGDLLVDLIRDELSRWKVYFVDNDEGDLSYGDDHVVVRKRNLGSAQWTQLSNVIHHFLNTK